MGLTGLEIYKQLPKKNCGECGPPTCLAFAMNLASGKADLNACPYLTFKAKEVLMSASAPPINLIKSGTGNYVVEMGDETELFRHDKKFHHSTAYAIKIKDNLSAEDIKKKAQDISNYSVERVGMEYRLQFIALENSSEDTEKFLKAVKIISDVTRMPMILISKKIEALKEALELIGHEKPILHAATINNFKDITFLAKEKDVPLIVVAKSLDELADLVKKITEMGHKQLILEPNSEYLSQKISEFVQIRRQAIKKKFRNFGYPLMAFSSTDDPLYETVEAVSLTSRYASLIVLNCFEKDCLLPLLTWRENLYADPQVPIQVEEKIYEVGQVDENSPVYLTTNFSLTFYTIQGEIENSKVPSYIIPIDTDGTSVLTAYSAGKLEPEKIIKTLDKIGIKDKIKHRDIIIPGLVAVIGEKLKKYSDWNILIGPREASGITAFAKKHFTQE